MRYIAQWLIAHLEAISLTALLSSVVFGFYALLQLRGKEPDQAQEDSEINLQGETITLAAPTTATAAESTPPATRANPDLTAILYPDEVVAAMSVFSVKGTALKTPSVAKAFDQKIYGQGRGDQSQAEDPEQAISGSGQLKGHHGAGSYSPR